MSAPSKKRRDPSDANIVVNISDYARGLEDGRREGLRIARATVLEEARCEDAAEDGNSERSRIIGAAFDDLAEKLAKLEGK